MNLRRIALLVAPCLIAGCRQDPYLAAHIEMVNAEKRALEDRVYELEYDNRVQAQELERLRQESQGAIPRPRDRSGREAIEEPQLSPPKVELPGETMRQPDEETPETLKPPVVEPGVPLGPTTEPSAPTYPALAPGSPDAAPAPPGGTQAPLPADTRIRSIQLHPTLTRGRNWDDQPGDDGLSIVIEPRNAAGACVPLPGAVTVAVLDAAETGEQRRVALWDIDAQEVARHVRNAPEGRGIYLDLPWPEQPPRHSQLSLFVRYVTADGRRLVIERKIAVQTPPKDASQWNPRSSPPAVPEKEKPPERVVRPQWSPYR